jgi:lipoprotein-releasing system ATP-binding protein
MDAIFKATNLNKSYDMPDKKSKQVILEDASFEIPRHCRIAILSPSGSGKSTLLNLLAALDSFDSGTVSFFPQSNNEIIYAPSSDSSKLRNKHFGFVFQIPHMLKSFSILDNIAMPMMIQKRQKKEREAKAQAMLKTLFPGSPHMGKKSTNTLSGGELQRVAIARAIIHKPEVIFADEPTGNLDEENAKKVIELLIESAKESTLILVTHNKELAFEYCTHIGRLEHKKLTISANPSKFHSKTNESI